MSLKRKLFLKLGPRATGRGIALLIAAVLCFGIYRIFPLISPSATPVTDTSANASNDTEKTEPETDQNNTVTPSAVYSLSGSTTLTTPLSSAAALLCSNADNAVIRHKSAKNTLPSTPILALSAALAVIDIISKGETSPSERAVCPATAIRLPSYDASSYILSVGGSLTVAELVKAMLHATHPELFAYTLAIHIYGDEQAFVNRLNEVIKGTGATDTQFVSVGDGQKQTTTAHDAAIIFRAATEDSTLLSLLSARESFTLSSSGSAWNTVTLCGRFYSECCTEGQAKSDGIICGYYGECDGKQFVYMLFEQLGTTYVTVALDGSTAYADSLILLSNAGR